MLANWPAINGANLDLLISLIARALYHHVDRFVCHWTVGIPDIDLFSLLECQYIQWACRQWKKFRSAHRSSGKSRVSPCWQICLSLDNWHPRLRTISDRVQTIKTTVWATLWLTSFLLQRFLSLVVSYGGVLTSIVQEIHISQYVKCQPMWMWCYRTKLKEN